MTNPVTGTHSATARLTLLAVACSVLASIIVFQPYPYDHVVSRMALVRQLSDAGTLSIDPYEALTSDKSLWQGRFFSDKSVLFSTACVPIAWAARVAGLSPAGSIPLPGFDPARYLCERVLVSGSFLILLLLLARRCRVEGVDPLPAVTALGLGSILLPYSTALYSHVPSAMLLFAGYILQKEERYRASDMCCALASALDYPVLLLYLILILFRPRRCWRPGPVIASAAILSAAFLPQMAYNLLCFGSPFRMGYAVLASPAFAGAQTGFFGFTLPRPGQLLYLIASPERGLFFYMPWAAAGIAGLVSRGSNGRLSIDPGAVLIPVFLVLFSALYSRTMGWAFGPRYLIPAIPFAALGLARFAARGPRARWAAALLVLPGIIQALLGLFGEMHLPVHPFDQAVPLPQIRISLEMLLDGHHSMWLAGLPGAVLVTAGAALAASSLFRGGRFSIPALAAVPALLLLALSSPGGSWGGRIDYYRGVLAEHRMEYRLAAGYYGRAALDPTAPPVVAERAARCGELADALELEARGSP
jgi:hypothetical protein